MVNKLIYWQRGETRHVNRYGQGL